MTAPVWLRPLLRAVEDLPPGSLGGRTLLPPQGEGRPAAVLVLFGEGPDGPDLLFIERAATLRRHAGQPAFPGGAVDPGDDGPAAAALREAWEETGVEPAGVEVLVTLPELWVPVSRFRVHPVLAWWREPTAVRPVDALEVATVERVPLAELADPANRCVVRLHNGYLGPAFDVRGLLVWGFTGSLVDRLLDLGGFARPWRQARLVDPPAPPPPPVPDSASGRPGGG